MRAFLQHFGASALGLLALIVAGVFYLRWRSKHSASDEAALDSTESEGKESEAALRMPRANQQQALEDAIIDRFLKRWDLPAHEWERLRERVIVIHDRMNNEEVCDCALGHVNEEVDEIEVERILLVSESRTVAFDALQALLPMPLRHRLIGRTDEPVEAALYETP